MTTPEISADHKDFLRDILTEAIDNSHGYNWFFVYESNFDIDSPYAIIEDKEEIDGARHIVDFSVVQHGLDIIRDANWITVDSGWDIGRTVLCNKETRKRLHMSRERQHAINYASRTHDASQLDIVDYLGIIECGIFGAVTYC